MGPTLVEYGTEYIAASVYDQWQYVDQLYDDGREYHILQRIDQHQRMF